MYNPLKPSKKIKAKPLDPRAGDAQKKQIEKQNRQKSIREMVENPLDSVEKMGFKMGDVLLQFAAEKMPVEIRNPEDMDLAITELGIAAHAWNLFVMKEDSSTDDSKTLTIGFFKHTKNRLTSQYIAYYKSRFEAAFSHHKFIVVECTDFAWHPKKGYNVDLMGAVIE